MEDKLDTLYGEIVGKVSEMIPEAWNQFYYYAQISDTGGEVYFFYKSEQLGDYVYSLKIPELFGVDESKYDDDEDELFLMSEKIRNIFRDNQQELWFSFTISLNDKGKFEMSYDYTNWFETEYGPGERMAIWKYKYLNIKPTVKRLQEALERYLVEYPDKPI